MPLIRLIMFTSINVLLHIFHKKMSVYYYKSLILKLKHIDNDQLYILYIAVFNQLKFHFQNLYLMSISKILL